MSSRNDDGQQPGVPESFEAGVDLDFALNQLTRNSANPVPLPRSLPVKMLEQLCRTKMSVPRFLLLPRFKQFPRHGGNAQLHNAFRHELSTLRRMIALFDLPIEIERDSRWIQAHWDCKRIRTNITQGRVSVKEAVARLTVSDFAGAIRFAEKALTVDFDCIAAAAVVVRVLRADEHYLNDLVVARAQVCLARAILRCTAAIRRFQGHRCEPDVTRARVIAERIGMRLEPQWHALLSWPCGGPPSGQVRDFIEMWVKTFRGDSLSYSRFINNSVVIDVVDHLLTKRVTERNSSKRKDMVVRLTEEVF